MQLTRISVRVKRDSSGIDNWFSGEKKACLPRQQKTGVMKVLFVYLDRFGTATASQQNIAVQPNTIR